MAYSIKSNVFGGGIPTEADVKRLVDRFGLPKVGELITYTEIADTIDELANSGRFRSVVLAWRKKLYRESNIDLIAERGKGYIVANNSQRIGYDAHGFSKGIRGIKRYAGKMSRTPEVGLTPEEMRVKDHIVKVGAVLTLTVATEAKRLRYETPIKK